MKRYIGVVLDEESKIELQKVALHPTVHGTHMTVVYDPTDLDVKNFENKFGDKIELEILGVASDKNGQAVLVQGFESRNKFPHITISCNYVEPVYSNKLFENNFIHPINIKKVSGELKLVID